MSDPLVKSNRSTPHTVVVAQALELHHLVGVFDHSIDAVIVPHYFKKRACRVIAERVKRSPNFGHYPGYPIVGRLGQELFECENEQDIARYQETALPTIREMRQLVHPYITPVDRIRVEVDDIWKHGCTLSSLNDKKMSAGVVREYRETSDAEPHCDVIGWDIIDAYRAGNKISNQIAVNVYLQTSDTGGELLFWDTWPTHHEYNMAHNVDKIGLDRQKIPPPAIELTPRQGDLILFNAMRIHSVKRITSGTRVTWACFLGFSGEDAPLVIWS